MHLDVGGVDAWLLKLIQLLSHDLNKKVTFSQAKLLIKHGKFFLPYFKAWIIKPRQNCNIDWCPWKINFEIWGRSKGKILEEGGNMVLWWIGSQCRQWYWWYVVICCSMRLFGLQFYIFIQKIRFVLQLVPFWFKNSDLYYNWCHFDIFTLRWGGGKHGALMNSIPM